MTEADFGEPRVLGAEVPFRTRAFEINYIAKTPGGIEFQTRDVLARPAPNEMFRTQGLDDKIADWIATKEIPAAINKAIEISGDTRAEQLRIKVMQDTFGFSDQQIQEYQENLRKAQLEEGILLTPEQHAVFMREYASSEKVGIVNPQFIHDPQTNTERMLADIRKVPFAFYRFIRTPRDVETGLIEYANPCGVALALRLPGWYGLGRRFENNGTYRGKKEEGGLPGAFAAGIWDTSRSRLTPPGKPEVITSGKARAMANLEARQEAGVGSDTFFGIPLMNLKNGDIEDYILERMQQETGEIRSDISNVLLVAFGTDLVNPHNELGIVAESNRTREELEEIHARAEKDTSEKHFSEGIAFIPDSADAIERLCCEVKCPMPPTHYMPYVSDVYRRMIVESHGDMDKMRQAEEWRERVQGGIDRNWQEIDEMVERFNFEHPDKADENERKAGRPINRKGYEPALFPTDQGLPSMNSEFRRTELITD